MKKIWLRARKWLATPKLGCLIQVVAQHRILEKGLQGALVLDRFCHMPHIQESMYANLK